MSGAERIEAALSRAKSAGRAALAAFVTAGYPDRRGFGALLEEVGAAADVVEVGVPFSDPMADGVTVQRASRRALEQGVNLRWILREVEDASGRVDAPIVLMSYLNPLLAAGLEELPRAAAGAGVAGMIVPDLPMEERAPLEQALLSQGLALIPLVAPTTPDERLAEVTRGARGFVYAVTVAGITGGSVHVAPGAEADGIATYLARVRAVAPVPVLAGFGIRTAADIEALAPHADGVVVGSALIEALERGDHPARFLRALCTSTAPARADGDPTP